MTQDTRERAADIVDSPLFKLMSTGFLILFTAILIPLATWGMGTVVKKLGDIEAAINAGNVREARNEERRLALEGLVSDNSRSLRELRDQVVEQKFAIQRLEEHLKARNKP